MYGITISLLSAIMLHSHQGICTSFMGGSSGWAFAIKKDCGGKHKDWTCDKLCGSMNEGQVLPSPQYYRKTYIPAICYHLQLFRTHH